MSADNRQRASPSGRFFTLLSYWLRGKPSFSRPRKTRLARVRKNFSAKSVSVSRRKGVSAWEVSENQHERLGCSELRSLLEWMSPKLLCLPVWSPAPHTVV